MNGLVGWLVSRWGLNPCTLVIIRDARQNVERIPNLLRDSAVVTIQVVFELMCKWVSDDVLINVELWIWPAPRYKSGKFKDWLLSGIVSADIRLNAFAVDILSYLAYETVAQVCCCYHLLGFFLQQYVTLLLVIICLKGNWHPNLTSPNTFYTTSTLRD